MNNKFLRLNHLIICPECKSALQIDTSGAACPSCGNRYLVIENILSFLPEQETHFWQQYHTEIAKEASRETEQVGYSADRIFWIIHDTVKRIVGPISDSNILDIGCGNGLMSRWLTKKNAVLGIDFSLEMLKFAVKKSLIPIHADAMKLPVKDSSFDIVLSNGTIQCFENAVEHIQYISKFVKPGGKLIISGLNAYSFLRKTYRAIMNSIKPGLVYPKLNDPLELANALATSAFSLEIYYTCYPINKVIHQKSSTFKKCVAGSNFIITAKRR